ncbi:MAG: hypothetical protein QGG73_09595 [Candidatus Hydrogenedentes bacterium]|jgi:DNA-binding PadR family transcriptional regulator|nr:hypothetical protein [Candidatus Hydrogenedentota bacterium]
MKSARYLDTVPAARPLLADDILEFHAARLLLLFRICGTANRIDGLTKMAKLDFFVRYPDFFARACRTEGFQCDNLYRVIESSMIRFHYGPWDQRYYHILAYIESKGLIRVTRVNKGFQLRLTEAGKARANRLQENSHYDDLCRHMKSVKRAFGKRTGSSLKTLIYRIFDEEVGQLGLGEVID